MSRKAITAITAQGVQSGISFVVQILVLRLLGIDDYGRFSVLYGVVVLVMAIMSGLVGDSLVVLHREEDRIRAGLEAFAVFVSLAAGFVAAVIAALSHFVSPLEGLAFGLGLVTYTLMEIVRRLLMAHMAFARAAVADICGFVIAGVVLAAGHLTHGLALWVFLLATATGQAVACLVGWRMLPSSERVLVPIKQPDLAAVWSYGAWRGLQQTLRPALYTIVRVLVIGFVSVAAVGQLEAARTYISPLLLVVGSLSAILFVRFANHAKAGGRGSLREADRAAGLLLLAAIALGACALILAPWAGPAIFGITFDFMAMVGWIANGVAIATVAPYVALSAVTGKQVAVFFIRLADTVLSIGLAAAVLASGASFAAVPFVIALPLLLGGLALRWVAAKGEGSPSVGNAQSVGE